VSATASATGSRSSGVADEGTENAHLNLPGGFLPCWCADDVVKKKRANTFGDEGWDPANLWNGHKA